METFQVYSFGSNSDGQLGYATTAKNIGIPALVESLQGRRRVKQIACGASSTYQLLENGECYAWGVLPGALVHSTTSRQIPQLTGKVAKHISCSSSPAMYSTVVLDSGECLLSQLGSDFLPSDKWGSARQVVATGTHFLALLEDGWVVQRDHRLGGLPSTEHQVLPPHHSIIAIAANELYSAALSDTGELYTWGIGPLGHKGASNPIKPKPEKVLGALENKRVISVACGREHMACVTDAGELYTWGSATRNQLGHGEVGAKLAEPQRVQALAGKKIVACSCGDYFSACVSDTGVLYTWGDGSTGALGHGEMTNESSPRLVEAFKNKTVKSVVCGACHTVCTVLAGINQNQSLLMADLGRICEAEELKGGHTLDEEECFYDVKLRCAREPLKPALRAHKAVLAARCPAWRALLPQQELKTVDATDESSSSSSPAAAAVMWELVVDGMAHAVMVEFVRYLYTDRVSPDIEDRLLVQLCVLAERFHLSRLQAKCQAYWEQGVTTANVEAKMVLLLNEEHTALGEAAEREESEASTLAVFTQLRVACVESLQQRLVELEAVMEASGPANPHANAQREQLAFIRQNLDRLRESVDTVEQRSAQCAQSLATDGVDNSAPATTTTTHHHPPPPPPPTTSTATTQPADKADDAAEHVNDDDDDDEFIQAMNEPAAEDDELLDYDEVDYAEVLRQQKAHEEKRVRVEKREAQKLRAKRESEDRQEEEATRTNHSLGADLGAYVGSALYADIVFEVEDVRIPAHKALLCARSSHFRAMLTSGMREAQSGRIVVPEISSAAFSTVLKYLYTSEADINEENVIELLIVCNLYSIQQLQEQCENYIESGIQLDNVTELLQMAHQFQTHHLRSVAMNYLVGRLKGDFSKLEGFSELSQDIQDEFKRGIPCPGESLIKAKSGGFQGKRFYFVVISRDFFKKRVIKGEEKWDIVVQFEPHPTDSAAAITTAATADQVASSNAGSAADGGDDADKGDDKAAAADDGADKADADDEGHHDAGAASSGSSGSGSSSDAMAKLFDFGLHSGTQRGRRPAGRRSHASGVPLRGRSDKHRTASSPLLPFAAPLGAAPTPTVPATTPTSPASPVSFDTSAAFDTPASPSSPSSFSFLTNTASEAAPSSPSSPSFSSSSSFFTTATTAAASPSPPSADIGTVLGSLTSTPASLPTASIEQPTKEPAPSTTGGAGFIRGRRRVVKKSVSAEVGDAGHAQASAASYFAATATTPATGNEEEEDIAAAAAIARKSAGDEEDRPSVLLTSNSDGTYTASFMPYKLGQYSISVSLNGTPIKNSPFHVRFEKPIFSRNCRAAFKGDSGSGVITAGKEATLIIQSRDINNRPITVGGAEPGFRVCVYLPSAKESTVMSSNPSFYFNPARQGLSDKGLTDVHVRDNKDGTYTATFALRRSGDFLVDVVRHEISDKMRLPIFGSPYPIACFPAGAHGPKCEAEGDGLVSAVMGKPASFRIRTFDRYANRRDVGGDTFVVRLIRRGAVPLVRNEEEEREKEEERKREENGKKQNEEKCSPGGMTSSSSTPSSSSTSSSSSTTPLTPEQQQQFEDENIDAAEQRRDDDRKNKKRELAERKRQQAEEWRRLDALLQQHELVRGVVTDEGDGTYHATYTVPPDIHDIALRNRAALKAAAAAAATTPAPDATSSSAAEATSAAAAEATSAAPAEATSAAAAEGDGGEWPQEYQLVVTLLDGGMVRDSPFNLLLLPEGFVFDDDHADVGAAPASLLGAPVTTPRGLTSAENAEPTTPRVAIQRVAGGDDNDAFLRGLKSDDSENDDGENELKSDREDDDADEKNESGKKKIDDSEDEDEGGDDDDDVPSKRVVRKVLNKKTSPRPRTLSSFAKPTTITTPPSFSPPTSPRAAPTSTASAPSSPFRLPSSSLLLPATATTATNPAALAPPVPLLPMPALAPAQPSFVPASPGSPFSTEIFSTMFTAHMELMQPDAATFSFSPSGAAASFLPPTAALPPPSFSFSSSSPAPSSGSPITTTTSTTPTTSSPFTFAFASPPTTAPTTTPTPTTSSPFTFATPTSAAATTPAPTTPSPAASSRKKSRPGRD